MDEKQQWKCLKHPSKRQRTGICPTCLRERLLTLCPECSSTRPCSCYPHDSTSSSSILQFSLSSVATEEARRMSTLIEHEPAFRKSRSLAVPIGPRSKDLPNVSVRKINLWSVFKTSKTRKYDLHDEESNKSDVSGVVVEEYSRMMRARSVAVGDSFGTTITTTKTKRRGWYLPSPTKAFRQSKTSKLQVNERSPMHGG